MHLKDRSFSHTSWENSMWSYKVLFVCPPAFRWGTLLYEYTCIFNSEMSVILFRTCFKAFEAPSKNDAAQPWERISSITQILSLKILRECWGENVCLMGNIAVRHISLDVTKNTKNIFFTNCDATTKVTFTSNHIHILNMESAEVFEKLTPVLEISCFYCSKYQ